MNNLEKAKKLAAATLAIENAALNCSGVCICVHLSHAGIDDVRYSVQADNDLHLYRFDADGELIYSEIGEPVSRELCKRKLMEFLKSES
jgi:hypothetical protein